MLVPIATYLVNFALGTSGPTPVSTFSHATASNAINAGPIRFIAAPIQGFNARLLPACCQAIPVRVLWL
jgi:hypothetical protein